MQDTPEIEPREADLPPNLRLLRNLVTVLTVVMILGVIAIVALLVIRLGDTPSTAFITPAQFAVPDGVGLVGYGVVDGAAVLIGDDGMIRVFDAGDGALLHAVPVRP